MLFLGKTNTMESLTQVYMFQNNKWRHVCAEDASKIYFGTVSAKSGIFRCNQCGQYIILTKEGDVKPYFKHSSSEKSKDCPARSPYRVSNSVPDRDYGKYPLPIRINIISPHSFELELGLIYVPQEISESNFLIKIKCDAFSPIVCSAERLKSNATTYLGLGCNKAPCKEYEIYFENINANVGKHLRDYWPKKVKGVDPDGTLFEKETCKMLRFPTEILVKKEYYLLIKKPLENMRPCCGRIKVEKVAALTPTHWFVYNVSATELNQCTVKFFGEKNSYWLSEELSSFQPVWPLFAESDNAIRHNNKETFCLLRGNRLLRHNVSYYSSPAKVQVCGHEESPDVMCFECYGTPYQYTYLWKEPIGTERTLPEIKVTDIKGNYVKQGEANELPAYSLLFESSYDGEVVISSDGYVLKRLKVTANEKPELDKKEIKWGLTIRFFVGMDCLWETCYKRVIIRDRQEDEEEMFNYIVRGKGGIIPAPHSLRNIALRLNGYPKLFAWIKKCIKTGKIGKQSYRRLQEVYFKVTKSTHIGG